MSSYILTEIAQAMSSMRLVNFQVVVLNIKTLKPLSSINQPAMCMLTSECYHRFISRINRFISREIDIPEYPRPTDPQLSFRLKSNTDTVTYARQMQLCHLVRLTYSCFSPDLGQTRCSYDDSEVLLIFIRRFITASKMILCLDTTFLINCLLTNMKGKLIIF